MPRTRRPIEERAAALDVKIKYHRELIAKLEAQKKDLITPKSKISKGELNKVSKAVEAALQNGLSVEDVIAKLAD